MIRHANLHIHRAPRNRRFDDNNSQGLNFITWNHMIEAVHVLLSPQLQTFNIHIDNPSFIFRHKSGKWRSGPGYGAYHHSNIIITDDHSQPQKRKVLYTRHITFEQHTFTDNLITFDTLNNSITPDSKINTLPKVIIKVNHKYTASRNKKGGTWFEDDREYNTFTELEHIANTRIQESNVSIQI